MLVMSPNEAIRANGNAPPNANCRFAITKLNDVGKACCWIGMREVV